MENRKKSFKVVLITGIILSALLCVGEYWNFHDGIRQEAVFIAAVVFLVVVFPLLVLNSRKLSTAVGGICAKIKQLAADLWQNRERILKTVLLYAGGIIGAVLMAVLFCALSGRKNNVILCMMFIAAAFLLVSAYVFKDTASEKPEKFFAAAALIAGTFFIIASPTEVGICWDDNYHYDGTVAMFTVNGTYYESDAVIIDNVANVALDHKCYDKETRAERDALIDQLYRDGAVKQENHANLGTNTLAYIPFGIGLLAGRGLHLPYTVTFRLEKFCNLLFYIAVIYFAIRKVRKGKILIAAIALLPTNLFLAGSFSYDPWITSLLILGFAYFFSYLQDPDAKLTGKDMLIIFGAFTLACIPKALYFVLMFPLAFMPADRFASKKQRIIYYISGVTIAFLLAASFAWPVLSQFIKNIVSPASEAVTASGSVTDAELAQGGRGGSAADQIAFITQNPGEYMRILFGFLIHDYVNPLSSPQYAANYAYLGFGNMKHLTPLTLLFVTVFDHDGEKEKTVPVIFSTVFAVICLLVLIPTALYIYYSPIGSTTIEGCQHRYLIPLLYPILYVNGIDKLKNRIPAAVFSIVPMLIMALVFVTDIGGILYSLY